MEIMFCRFFFFCVWKNPDGCTLEFNHKFKCLITFYEYMQVGIFLFPSFFFSKFNDRNGIIGVITYYS